MNEMELKTEYKVNEYSLEAKNMGCKLIDEDVYHKYVKLQRGLYILSALIFFMIGIVLGNGL